MKLQKQFLLIGIVATFTFTSCTMEKRVYMSGYNIGWLNSKHNNPVSQAPANKEKITEQNKTEPIPYSQATNIKISDDTYVIETKETDILASNDKHFFYSPQNDLLVKRNTNKSFSKNSINIKSLSYEKSNKKLNVISLKNDTEKIDILVLISIILGTIGNIVYFLIPFEWSIPVILIFGILSTIFSLTFLLNKNKLKTNENKKTKILGISIGNKELALIGLSLGLSTTLISLAFYYFSFIFSYY